VRRSFVDLRAIGLVEIDESREQPAGAASKIEDFCARGGFAENVPDEDLGGKGFTTLPLGVVN